MDVRPFEGRERWRGRSPAGRQVVRHDELPPARFGRHVRQRYPVVGARLLPEKVTRVRPRGGAAANSSPRKARPFPYREKRAPYASAQATRPGNSCSKGFVCPLRRILFTSVSGNHVGK